MSGGGYIASSLLALQHAYQESHTREGMDPPRSPHTKKVQLPSKVMFAYLTALQENVGIFVEGWSGRFFVDVAVFVWTLLQLLVFNALTCTFTGNGSCLAGRDLVSPNASAHGIGCDSRNSPQTCLRR